MTAVWVALALCLLGILASGLFSGAETGAYLFNRTRHRLALAEGDPRARLLARLTADLTSFLVVCLIGTNLANSLVSYAATVGLAELEAAHPELAIAPPELLSTLVVVPILFILGELAPKELFRRHPRRLLRAAAPLVSLAAFVFRPLSRALGIVAWILRAVGLRDEDDRNQHAEERVRQAIAAGAEGGTLTEYQATLARNIFSLRSRKVRHAMTPLDQVTTLEPSCPLPAARSLVLATDHGRFPVYDPEARKIVGLVDGFELLLEERDAPSIDDYVRPVQEVDPQEKVAEALLRLRRARANLAVVRRADGPPLGIITMKDLVEEITGELQDL